MLSFIKMENIEKIIPYGIGVLVTSIALYKLLNPIDISEETHPELFKPVSPEAHDILMNRLGGIYDGGYKLDRELIGINERSWED